MSSEKICLTTLDPQTLNLFLSKEQMGLVENAIRATIGYFSYFDRNHSAEDILMTAQKDPLRINRILVLQDRISLKKFFENFQVNFLESNYISRDETLDKWRKIRLSFSG